MDWNIKENQELIRAVLALATEDEARRFLRDLMTEGEIEEFGRRLQVAKMLKESIPYSQIAEKTGMSSTTIARVAKWLNGEQGGYKTIIDRLHHDPIQPRRGLS